MGYIYWVASYPKSGNTWMRAFLTNLVSPTEETSGINHLSEVAPEEHFGLFYQPFLTKPLAEARLEELAAIRPLVHQAIADAVEGFIFLKTHSMLARHLGTPTISPAATAGAIYIVRNPLDVVVSYSKFRNLTIDETIGIVNRRGFIMPKPRMHSYVPSGSWAENVRSWTKRRHDRLLVLRYEDMLEDPAAAFGAVARLLRIDATAEAIERAIQSASFDRLKGEEQQGGFAERPPWTKQFFRSGTAGQWREELTPAQIREIALPNKSLMVEFGYWSPELDP